MTAVLPEQPQRMTDAHPSPGLPRLSPVGAYDVPVPSTTARRQDDSLLLIYADALDDFERTRIATQNRVRALVDLGGDGTPEVARLQGLTDALFKLEHDIELQLGRAVRRHQLGPWIKSTVGVGERQGGRLLAAIGDPASRRTVSQLWAYCGLHVVPAQRCIVPHAVNGGSPSGVARIECDTHPPLGDAPSDPGQATHDAHPTSVGVAPRRTRGQRSNWSSTARMRAYLVAKSCMRNRQSPYRAVYDDRRAHTAITHPDWTPAHSDNDALRITAKAILRDLWIEARRLERSSR